MGKVDRQKGGEGLSTPYSKDNQAFSDLAHLSAQSLIYPKLFNIGKSQLEFESTSLSMGDKQKILDGQMAVDRIVKVSVNWFNAPIEFTVQERFRRPEFARYKDITITEWNHKTNVKSELYKLNAGIFLYGYFDDNLEVFDDWIAVNTTSLLHRLVVRKPKIKLEFNPRSNQSFYCLEFEHLEKAGVVLARMDK